MKRIKLEWAVALIAIALALWLGLTSVKAPAQFVGPVNQIFCNRIGTLTAGSTGDQQVIAAVSGQRIYVCGWHITNTGASGTFAFDQGTGSNCGTGNANIIPAQNVTSNAPSADHIDYAQIQTNSGAAFCINPSVGTIAGLIYFAQF